MSDSTKRETEVLVVGAGVTGLMMVCELFRRGIACRIIIQSAAPLRDAPVGGP
jgi:2-polyprenyl-6-methoxyphenol hydroxylase-like FAD-dependent oxidoreductase